MAILKDVIDERFGSLVNGAYIRLAYVRWSTADKKTVATFSVFASEQAMLDKKEAVSSIEVDVPDFFPNMHQKLYAAIKALPEYADAIDSI